MFSRVYKFLEKNICQGMEAKNGSRKSSDQGIVCVIGLVLEWAIYILCDFSIKRSFADG